MICRDPPQTQISSDLVAIPSRLSGHAHLELHHDAAYTTMRTVGEKVFRYSEHVQRLVRAQNEHCAIKTTLSELRQQLSAQIKQLLKCKLADNIRIYAFVDYCDGRLSCFAEPLTIARQLSKLVTVEIERPDPTIKDSAWVRLRGEAEKLLSADVNEAIIYRRDGVVTEGLSSNVFVVKENEILTAPLGIVLGGTMRASVIEVSQAIGMVVVEKEFTLAEMMQADEVFVCSTSRFVVCATQVDEIPFKTDIGLKIRNLLEKQVSDGAEDVE